MRKSPLFSSPFLLVLMVRYLLWPLHFTRNILQVTLMERALIFPQKWKSFASIAYHTEAFTVHTFKPITMFKLNSCFSCASITGVVGVLVFVCGQLLYCTAGVRLKLTSASGPQSWNLIPQGPGQWRRQERGSSLYKITANVAFEYGIWMWHSPYLICVQFLNSIWRQDSNTISIHISRMKSGCQFWNIELLFHGYVSKHSEHMGCLMKKMIETCQVCVAHEYTY